jgi:hypothetical protein
MASSLAKRKGKKKGKVVHLNELSNTAIHWA